MKEECFKKYDRLKDRLKGLGQVAIAFSGGVDSTLLLYAAVEALGKNIIAVTAVSEIRHKEEKDRAHKIAKITGVKHFIVSTEELSIPEVKNNSIDRCYHCKKNIFSKVMELAEKNGISLIAEASTCDDEDVFRPGRRAIKELGVLSPLAESGFSKKEVTETLKNKRVEIFNTPSESCLLTRFPYAEAITGEKLTKVRLAEEYLKEKGFLQVRVRTYDDLARIEVSDDDIAKLLSGVRKDEIVDKMKSLGYKYVTVDIEGFRSGSMDL